MSRQIQTMRHLPFRCLLLVLPLLLVACAKGTGDLRQWVNEEKAKRGQPLEPPPGVRTFENFEYVSQEDFVDAGVIKKRDRRDPFRLRTDEKDEDAEAEGLRPDPTRRRELLESFSLDALAMVGTLGEGDAKRALVRAPDNVIHRVVIGNHLGQNYGRVTNIADNEITLLELVPDGTGSWMERTASMALREN